MPLASEFAVFEFTATSDYFGCKVGPDDPTEAEAESVCRELNEHTGDPCARYEVLARIVIFRDGPT